MAKAFLSHSSDDKTIVRKIAAQLGNKNCTLDEISFEPGRKSLDEIFKELESSDIFVLFISKKSLESKWVKKEIIKAKRSLLEEYIDRILPIIIDKDINHKNPDIPSWISKPYNLKYISNEVIILKKIRQSLREVSFKKNIFNQKLDKIFIGRNNEMQTFESDINNLDNWMPTYIIAYNFYEGIGRRTFLINALRKSSLIDYLYSPTTITLDSKESIENFIFKLNTFEKNENIVQLDFSNESLDRKIEIAIEQIKQFVSFKELIFIIDDGCIVLPNNKIVDWFTKIVNHKDFNNNLVFCLISKYKPKEHILKTEKKSLVYRIPELSNSETQNLFIKLLNIYDLGSLKKEDKTFFIEKLSGNPAQITYAINLININPIEAKKYISDIIEYSDSFSTVIINNLKKNEIAFQMAILLSKSEIFSIEIIEQVFGKDETENALEYLFNLSLLNFAFGNFQYLKLNSIISDYINRSKLNLHEKYNTKFNFVTKELLSENLDKQILDDYSGFIITLQKMLEEGQKIPKKYFIPALILKNIIKEYDKGNYPQVIKTCLGLLDNNNYDSQIIWETKYRLTLAYARTRNEDFFKHISFFNNDINRLDYYFLLGFYYRHKGMQDKALENYYKVLDIQSEHSRTKREVVNILLSQEKYSEALNLARENYEKRKTNIYHIQSYFVCLLKNREIKNQTEVQILKELMYAVKKSSDIKAEDIYRCMEGEYEFYVNDDFDKAFYILNHALSLNENKNYPQRCLTEIHKKKGLEYNLANTQSNFAY